MKHTDHPEISDEVLNQMNQRLNSDKWHPYNSEEFSKKFNLEPNHKKLPRKYHLLDENNWEKSIMNMLDDADQDLDSGLFNSI